MTLYSKKEFILPTDKRETMPKVYWHWQHLSALTHHGTKPMSPELQEHYEWATARAAEAFNNKDGMYAPVPPTFNGLRDAEYAPVPLSISGLSSEDVV